METTFDYIEDEASIARRLDRPITDPIRLFTLDGLGLDQERFLGELAPTFSLLDPDEYLLKLGLANHLKQCCPDAVDRIDGFLEDFYSGDACLEDVYDLLAGLTDAQRYELDRIRIKDSRARSISRYRVCLKPEMGGWQIFREPVGSFMQGVRPDDIRAFPRVFRETSRVVSEHPEFQQFLRSVAQMVREVRPGVLEIEMTLHQMAIYADVLGSATNSPEGTHQDGADYIISALIVERAGVEGGESVVLWREDGQETECLRRVLRPGEGLFHADRGSPLWHHVTPIFEDPSRDPPYGHRSILGLDINVIREAA